MTSHDSQLQRVLENLQRRHGAIGANLLQFASLLKAGEIDVTTTQLLVAAQGLAAIDVAVKNLPSDYRELIQLRHFAELSYEEIASMKKLPLGTVKNKLFRARNLLKVELEGFVEPL